MWPCYKEENLQNSTRPCRPSITDDIDCTFIFLRQMTLLNPINKHLYSICQLQRLQGSSVTFSSSKRILM